MNLVTKTRLNLEENSIEVWVYYKKELLSSYRGKFLEGEDFEEVCSRVADLAAYAAAHATYVGLEGRGPDDE